MQIADHRQDMPMWYYRFTFEQASYRWPIRDIWNWNRTFRPLIDAAGKPSLSYRRSLMLMIENESIRICEFIGVFQISSSIVTDNRDDQTIKVFKKCGEYVKNMKVSFRYYISSLMISLFFISIPVISSLFKKHVFKILQIFPEKYFSKTWGVNPTIQI